MSRVLISAGHTMMDPGAIYQDLREADLTRKIAPKVISTLQRAGVEVQAVPLDLPLWQRLEWINNSGYDEANGDILVEVHINDSDGSKSGVEVWYKGNGGNPSQKLAKTLADTLAKDGYQNQGVRSEYEHELGSLTFLNRPKPTPVLLETLYLDNPGDIAKLKSDQELSKLAASIAKGILLFLGKDERGQALPADRLPKYDDLKPYSGGNNQNDIFSGLGDDLDDEFDNDFSFPAPVPKATTPNFPAPSFTPPKPMGTAGGLGGSSMMMDRNSRKKMIEDLYGKILGRAPTQSDLNYFLNQGINETDLVKKMADSQEHADLVKSKKQLEELNFEHEKLKSTIAKLEATIRDQKDMMNNFNNLIAHKNKAIQDLENAFKTTKGVPSQVAIAQGGLPGSEGVQRPKTDYVHQEGFKEKLFKFLSKRVN